MDQTEDDAAILTIESADGSRYAVRLLAAFAFDGQDYGVFIPTEISILNDEKPPAIGDLTIMQIVRKGDGEVTFREIADEKEHARVVAHVEERMRKNDE